MIPTAEQHPTPRSPTGWMKLALRAQVCPQCDPSGCCADPIQRALNPHACESHCALFRQLPRLARLLQQYAAKPPAGYEDFALQCVSDSTPYAPEGLAILEKVTALVEPANQLDKARLIRAEAASLKR